MARGGLIRRPPPPFILADVQYMGESSAYSTFVGGPKAIVLI